MTATLPVKADLEVVFGASNISQWADADNSKSLQEKNARITWAIQRAYEYILGRISRRYDITTFVEYPGVVFDLIAKRAGIELYSSPRGLVDGDAATSQLNSISLAIEVKLDQILSGQLVLIDAPVEPINTPGINNSTARFPHGGYRHNEQWTGDPCIISDGRFY